MNITETKIPDVTKENLDQSKVILANSIVENVYPIFSGLYSEKIEEKSSIRAKIRLKKTHLQNEKQTIENMMNRHKRQKKISKLLDRLDQLVSAGLTYDGTLKYETVILLKIIDKLPPDKLDYQLTKTIQMVNKRFSR